MSLGGAHFFTTDGGPVTVRFLLHDGVEFGYVRADRYEERPTGILFLLGMEVVAGLGPLKLTIYRQHGEEQSVERDRLAPRPFVVSSDGSTLLPLPPLWLLAILLIGPSCSEGLSVL